MAHNCLLKAVSDVNLTVGCSLKILSVVLAIGRLLPHLLNSNGSSHCTFSLVADGTVVAVVRCTSRFLASTLAAVRTFWLLLFYFWCEFAHFTQNFTPRWTAISLPSLTVRLTCSLNRFAWNLIFRDYRGWVLGAWWNRLLMRFMFNRWFEESLVWLFIFFVNGC